jgi:integrase
VLPGASKLAWRSLSAGVSPIVSSSPPRCASCVPVLFPLGRPSRRGLACDPARLRRVWYRLMRQAGVPKITPYTASRHAAGSYLGLARVSPAVIAAWLGHADAAFTMTHYVHARPEDLATARDALAARKTAEE